MNSDVFRDLCKYHFSVTVFAQDYYLHLKEKL